MTTNATTTLYGFELIHEADVPEINTHARLFRHVVTGAELLSLENDDENKVFGIAFRTPPPDSTGLPHIMEHSVLGGSRKYPVKEPFVELLKGSLNTFVNAFTSPDKTTYPVASTNVKDFYNLVDVYLDAVFYPRISPQTLQQEGWHFELEAPDSPLEFKGVVYNEMKGAYSSPENVLSRYSLHSLFPDTPLALDSGGDPAVIPDLTYAQFKAFHQAYYHPANARILFYGDDDPDERLRIMQGYLKDFQPNVVDSAIPLQPLADQPRRITVSYDAGEASDEAKKGMVNLNWLLAENTDAEAALGLGILEHILIGTPASPLRKALIDSGLGEDLTGDGLEDDLRQMVFSVGLKGIAVEDAATVETLIMDTLAHLADEGIDPDTVAASLNTVEFRLRENNSGRYPRGLLLMLRSLSTWLHDGDPLAPLAFEAPLLAIKSRVDAGAAYFESLIKQHLVDNAHRTVILLKPDPNVRAEQEAAERKRLDEARAAMSAEDVQRIIEDTRELKRMQETPDTPEALATIPMLTLADLDKENKLVPQEIESEQGCQILYHDLFTNGIVYLDVGFDLHVLPERLLPLVPLFGQALVKMGTESESFVKLSQRIGAKTGGIRPDTFSSAIRGSETGAARLFLRAKSTVAQADDMLAILRDVLLTAKLDDPERFSQIVLEAKAGTESALVPSGHLVVHRRMGAHFHEAGWVAEQMEGVSALFAVRRLTDEIKQDWPSVLAKLEQIRRTLIGRDTASAAESAGSRAESAGFRMVCNVTLDADNWAGFRPKLAGFVSELPALSAPRVKWAWQPSPRPEGLVIPARVNYVAKGANLYDLGYALDGSSAVITSYLRTTYLHDRVRAQGGAYGAFCVFDQHSGLLDYISYRDPNLLGTLANYDGTGRFLRELALSSDELTKGIIGAIGRIDDYQLPDAKGYSAMSRHLIGLTDEQRQRFRDQVLSTTAEDFRAFGEVLDAASAPGYVVVLGSQEAIDAANAERGDWLEVIKVL